MADYKDYGYENSLPTHAHQYIAKPILKLLNTDNQTILDLGCGNGAFVNLMVNKGLNAYGTDASAKGIQIASELLPERFALQDLATDELPLQFAHLKFDTIIATEVIEHLYDPRKFISFCKKILLKNGGGELILSTPYHGYLKNLLLAVTGKWDQHANPLWDGGHIKLWSKHTLCKLLTEQGFTVTDFVGCGRIPYVWMSMVIKARI
ncbi:MAG: class I SAM-dependent methyltransferase [Pedobacter sp.]|nr:MAG: class I SAM-dependent methyltransferase [Pedobacter sp.]